MTLNKCCPSFPESMFRHNGSGKYECCECRRDVSLDVLNMFLKDPWGTLRFRKPTKKEGAE